MKNERIGKVFVYFKENHKEMLEDTHALTFVYNYRNAISGNKRVFKVEHGTEETFYHMENILKVSVFKILNVPRETKKG